MGTAKRDQTREELLERFHEQMRFIFRSAERYDQGDFSEGRRVATHLRTLFHDTGRSKALLTTLGVLPGLRLYDSADNASGIAAGGQLVLRGMVMLRQSRAGQAHYVPIFDRGPYASLQRRTPFAEWWGAPIFTHAPSGNSFSRRDFVLYVADKDGGAHVDPKIDERWALLTRDHAFDPFVSVGDGKVIPFQAIDLAHVCQIAYEAFFTLRESSELAPEGDKAWRYRRRRGAGVRG